MKFTLSARTLQIAGPRRCLIVEASCLIRRVPWCGAAATDVAKNRRWA
jgi:hypothetical protein